MTTIAFLASEMATKYGVSYDAMLTTVTTYAASLSAPVFEGGQCPDVELSTEQCESIVIAYEAQMEI